MIPKLIIGDSYQDERGSIRYNNNYDLSLVKRMYVIQNVDSIFIRRWQGHKIEKRWFTAIFGQFLIVLIKIDHWNSPSKDLEKLTFKISSDNIDVLYIPGGYVSSIQALSDDARLAVMADYKLNEISDEYRYSSDYFND